MLGGSMNKISLFRAGAFSCLALLAAVALARADDAPAATPTPGAPAKEELTLRSFGAQHPDCMEWNDGCATCLRDAAGAVNCSTRGIACQPQEIACRSPKP
jgi:hypothetical protein